MNMRLPALHCRLGIAVALLGNLLCAMFVACLLMATTASSQTFPLRVSPSGHYLEDQTGAPFFISGEAAWSLIVQPTTEEADLYLSDRKVRGFNAIIIELIEHHYADRAPANIYRQSPWLGSTFTTYNEAYFQHADSVIRRAGELGICVFLVPLYVGYNCGDQGWCAEMKTAGPDAMKTWGTYVGNRYKSFPNIVWVVGGDTDPTPVRTEVDAFTDALRAADTVYPNRIITAHGGADKEMVAQFPEPWMNLNGIYTWKREQIVPLARAANARTPIMPYILLESNYENERGTTARQLRYQAYAAVLNGACGQFFGNSPIWYFSSSVIKEDSALANWTKYLDSDGSRSMTHLGKLLSSFDWWKLIPDTSHSILSVGISDGLDNPIFAYTSDSTTIVGYLPLARSMMIDPRLVKGDSIEVTWFNASTGEKTSVGRLPKVISALKPPGMGDWVVVEKSVQTQLGLNGDGN